MELITTRDRIRDVATDWRRQYPRSKMEIRKRLEAIDGETATADDVESIIGNRSWTRLSCDECDTEVDAIVVVGQEPDYESETASICKSCADKALKLFLK